MANWSDVGEHGLLGVKQIAIDSKNFAKGIKRGLQDPEDINYYWPQARVRLKLTTTARARMLAAAVR